MAVHDTSSELCKEISMIGNFPMRHTGATRSLVIKIFGANIIIDKLKLRVNQPSGGKKYPSSWQYIKKTPSLITHKEGVSV
jgi:hypothetical protein